MQIRLRSAMSPIKKPAEAGLQSRERSVLQLADTGVGFDDGGDIRSVVQ